MFDEDRRSRIPQKRRIGIGYILRTLLICVVIAVIISMQVYRFGNAFKYWWSNRGLKQHYVQEVNVLMQQQESMKKELNKLKYNTLTQERLAREMGYVRPGEVVYKLTNINQDNSSKDKE